MKYFLGIDIGGSWIKAIVVNTEGLSKTSDIARVCESAEIIKVKSRLSAHATPEDFIQALEELLERIAVSTEHISGIGVSTAGIVNYHGTKLELCAPHLSPLKSDKWIIFLREKTSAPVVLINDADAVTIGAASLGYLSGNSCYGIMPIGTGIGFTVVRNGRRWTPNYSLTLLGSIYSPEGGFDALGSASSLAQKSCDSMLQTIFIDEKYADVRAQYLHHLAGIISSAHVLYGVEKVLLGGGLVDAASQYGYGYNLEKEIEQILKKEGVLTSTNMKVRLLNEGNLLPLIGAVLLSVGESHAQSMRQMPLYAEIKTENAYDPTLFLNKMSTFSILELLNKVEQEAGEKLFAALPKLAEVIDIITERLEQGGRLIYVGCGTSGRLAAVDTVEIACTFGFPRDKVLTFISGGIADAAIDIETRFEEDASAVPELLMANITAKDVLIGISVSGMAYYVQSALGLGKFIGATTIMIQEKEIESLPFCDYVLPLHSGSELIAGSTRMKAGTATKKMTNFLSTTVMIKLGKVHGTYMVELECINEKLIKRATNILESLFGLSQTEALFLLKDNNFKLIQVVKQLEIQHQRT